MLVQDCFIGHPKYFTGEQSRQVVGCLQIEKTASREIEMADIRLL